MNHLLPRNPFKNRFTLIFLLPLALLTALFWANSVQAAPETSGILFDGTDSFHLPAESLKLTPSNFSVSAWVKMDRQTSSQIFLTQGEPGKDWTLYAYLGRVRMLVQLSDDGAYTHANIPQPETGKWFHLAGTCDGKTIRLYLDGKEAASQKVNVTRAAFSKEWIRLGAVSDIYRNLTGALEDVRLYSKVLTPEEVKLLAEGKTEAETLNQGLAALWNSENRTEKALTNLANPNASALLAGLISDPLLNTKDDGFRSIWYYNQASGDKYVYKYSGGLGTYPANHYPYSVYRPEVNKTFICFGGTDHERKTLLHEVSYFDHATGKLARPTIILDKKTDDAHDNPVMSMDDEGRIWIFSTSHGTGRPSYIHRSVRPYDISEFEQVRAVKIENGKEVPMTNFSYVQVFNVRGEGMFAFFTTYDRGVLNDPASRAGRIVSFMKSKDGVHWSEWKPLAAMEYGHYQNAAVWKRGSSFKIGSAFNYHPHNEKEKKFGLNWRTNLYYIESLDGGETWRTIDGKPLNPVLKDENSAALVYDYESRGKNVYIMDLIYDENGFPVIFYITSNGWMSGPEAGPREWFTCAWNGKEWEISKITESDNNYDFGSIYIEKDGSWRMVGTDGFGPQKYNTGGEVSLWTSKDRGRTWKKERQMTDGSEKNHCYPRRPIDWHEDFFAFWADGHGRQPSEADLYFSNIRGDVFKLPRKIPEGVEMVEPEKIRQPE